jgi:outer membrane protein, heavy metal efflux system
MNLRTLVFTCAVTVAVCYSSPAQQNERKSYTLRGTVEQVDTASKRLQVANEPVPGGMAAMTMTYKLDSDAILSRLKPGDRISAKVFEGDQTLYDVQIEPSSAGAPAQGPNELRLDDLEKMALAGNPTIAQAQANVRVAASLARQAGLYPNPTVGYYADEVRGGYSGGGKQGGFISQTIVTGGKLRAAKRVADLVTSQTETSGELQRLRILNNVRSMFYQVLGEQRLVDVRQNLAKLASDTAQTSHQLANIGQADRPDVLQAEVEQQQAMVGLRLAEQSLRSSWRTLAAVVGKPELPQTHLTGDLEATPDLNYEESLATTLRDSPEIKLARQEIDRAEASLAQARKVPIPDLQLSGNLSQNNEPLETTRRPTGLNGGIQIGVQLPLFNRNQGGVAAANAEIEVAKQEVARLRLQIAHDLANDFRDYESARATVMQYKNEMLPRAEQAYKLYQANYRNMAAAYPQALISQRTLFQLEVDYVQALVAAWQAAIGIRGFGLMDGLFSPSGTPGRIGLQNMTGGILGQ